MLRYMLDTNICIFTIKNKPAVVRQAFRDNQTRLCMGMVTLMELVHGAERSARPEDNLAVVESFSSRLEILAYDKDAAMHTAQYVRSWLVKLPQLAHMIR